MNTHQKVIANFFTSFQNKDLKGMIECYHPQIHFKDEIFDLKGKNVQAMWHMLCESGKDLEITFEKIMANKTNGSANWEAIYTFPKTKRKVHNKIRSHFTFKEGKIIEHIDSFSFWKWAYQALGTIGFLIGWTSFLKNKISVPANRSLDKFIDQHAGYK